jgi:hypothetical protein
MKSKKVFHAILIIVFIYAPIFCGSIAQANDGKANKNVSDIPIYRNAYKVKYLSENDLITEVVYNAKINYPATEIIGFYENEMLSRGYKADRNIHMHGCDGDWSYYLDGTIENKPSVASINLCWTKGEKLALLLIKYYYFQKNRTSIVLETLDDVEVRFSLLNRGG